MNRKRRDAGFSLAALVLFAAAASILLSAAIPAYQLQAKRELEEELIFRGEEYVRAIQKFQRRFNMFPPDVDALLETNGVRFLRKEYKDPITGEPMRLISISPDGTVTGSTIMTQRINNQPLFVTRPQALGETQPRGGGERGEGLGPVEFGPRANAIVTQLQQELAERMQRLGQSASDLQIRIGGVIQQGGGTGSSGIIGVASDSDQESLKVYNERQKYNEWEFIAPLQPPPGAGGGGEGGGRGGGDRPPPPPPPGNQPPKKN